MQQLDLLFCRNVTIYFDRQTTQRVIEAFYNCLSSEGYLFLGHTETLWQVTDKFERVEFPQTFIYKKGLRPVWKDAAMPWEAPQEIENENVISNGKGNAEGRLASPQESEPRPEGAPGDREPVETPPDASFLSHPPGSLRRDDSVRDDLMKATTLVNEAKYEEAAALLEKIIETDNLSAEAYYLLGVLRYKSSHLKEAEDQFRKVIYIRPDTVLAYFNLGNTYSCQGKFRDAAREFRNAIRLLEKKSQDEEVLFCEEVTAGFLLKACKNNLGEISKRGDRYE
jgi:chemotaxis protein methyltransferase CheR